MTDQSVGKQILRPRRGESISISSLHPQPEGWRPVPGGHVRLSGMAWTIMDFIIHQKIEFISDVIKLMMLETRRAQHWWEECL